MTRRIPDESGLAQHYLLDRDELDGVELVVKETTSQQAMMDLMSGMTKDQYSHHEIFGDFCSMQAHIDAPYDVVFEYCANTRSLEEWTYSIRGMEYVAGEVYRATDGIQPDTTIYIRTHADRGPDHGVVVYTCAWDQGHELWMRYYLTIMDSTKPLGRPGTVVLWTNCKHPYYDRATTDVPDYIEAGRSRTDRLWVGDIWPVFHAAHLIEIRNLKSIVEHRFGN